VKIGLVGTGKMGKAMALRLLEKGYSVSVWNRTPDKVKDLRDVGALVATSPRQLAEAVDIVITVLTNKTAQQAVFGQPETGLLAVSLSGKTVVDMSTVRPEASLALNAAVTEKGGLFVESPVGGTVGPAREGKLFAFVGASPEAFGRVAPLLNDLCRRVEHVGPVGAGASMKLAVNLPLVVFWQAFGEALSLVAHLDIPADRLIDILADTSGASTAFKSRTQQFIGRLQGGPPFPASFDIQSIRKDLSTMQEEAQSRGIPLPVVSAAITAYNESIAQGLDKSDSIEQSLFWHAKGIQR